MGLFEILASIVKVTFQGRVTFFQLPTVFQQKKILYGETPGDVLKTAKNEDVKKHEKLKIHFGQK